MGYVLFSFFPRSMNCEALYIAMRHRSATCGCKRVFKFRKATEFDRWDKLTLYVCYHTLQNFIIIIIIIIIYHIIYYRIIW